MKKLQIISTIIILFFIVISCTQPVNSDLEKQIVSTPDAKITATVYNSGFEHSHDTYNGLSSASDGKIYYVLCSTPIDVAGQMYCFDPETKNIEHLGDLSEVCGEKGLDVIAQGKSHVNFMEVDGKLYLGTHLGYYSIIDGKEQYPVASEGIYRGGHLLSFDMKSKVFEDLAIVPEKEAVMTMNMDVARGFIYGLSWPTGFLFRYSVATKEMENLGPVTGKGEAGEGEEFRVICRSMALNPDDGTIYFTNAEGDILYLKLGEKSVGKIEVEDVNLRKDYFGVYEPSTAGSMAYNWRQVFWYPPEKVFYGVHGNSGYLFTFDPKIPRIEVLERLTSIPSRLSGMNDQFSYGYLGFKLGPDGRTIYYLTGAPIYIDGKRLQGAESTAKGEAKGLEDLHLITYDIPTGKYIDHGAVFFPDGERPLYVNSIAIDTDGTVYSLGRVNSDGKILTELFSIPNPFKK
jgi:hypothetical protein